MDPDIAIEFPQPAERMTLINSACVSLEASQSPHQFRFWGCIHGVQNDYLIIQSMTFQPFIRPLSFYSRDGLAWSPVPEIPAALLAKAPFFQAPFIGDPASPVTYSDFTFSNGVTSETNNQVREEDRLAFFIREVDSEGFMIPKGSYELLPSGYLRPNPFYKGLSYVECHNLRSYLTFVLLDREKVMAGIGDYKRQDALQPLLQVIPDHATPRGRWMVKDQPWGSYVVMTNKRFPGLEFYIAPNSPSFGRFYSGNGLREIHEPFVYKGQNDDELHVDVGFVPDYDYKLPPELRPQEDPEPLALIIDDDKTYTSEIASLVSRFTEDEPDTTQTETSDLSTAETLNTSPPGSPTNQTIPEASDTEASGDESESK